MPKFEELSRAPPELFGPSTPMDLPVQHEGHSCIPLVDIKMKKPDGKGIL